MFKISIHTFSIPFLLYTILSLTLLTISCQEKNMKPSQDLSTESQDIRKKLEKVFEKNQLMGMSVILIRDNAISWQGNFGLADSVRQIPITDNTAFRVASISKSIVTVAVLQLWEEGKLDIDANVSAYLDWDLKHPLFPENPISLRHLLNHRSGIRDGSHYMRFAGDMVEKRLNLKELFIPGGDYYHEDMFADHAPGGYFAYTNSTWGIIASVVEKVSGERFDVYCKKNILEPLGMKASFNTDDLENMDDLAVLYRYPDGKWIPQTDDHGGNPIPSRVFEGYTLGQNGLIFGPQGSLRSSAKDLATFALMLMNDGKWNDQQIIWKPGIDLMQSNHWTYDGENGDTWNNFFLSYGLGMHRITNQDSSDIIFPDRKMFGHPGIAYGLLSDMYFDKNTKSGIVFITNGSKLQFKQGKKTSFYQVEEDVFEAVLPFMTSR